MKPVLYLIAVVLLFFVGDRAVGAYLRNQTQSSQFRYSRLYNGRAGAEILLLGNSRGLTFFQPHIETVSGKRTFNLSYNGLPMDLANVLAQDYLDRYPAPQVMVIDITLCDRENHELTTAFLTYADCSQRLDAFLEQQKPDLWWGGKVSHLMRYNNEVFQRALYYRNRSDADWLLDRVITDRLAAQVDSMSYGMTPKLAQPLFDLVAYARTKNVPVKLVIGPYFPGFSKRVERLDDLKQQVEQQTGLPVHDYRDALTDPTVFGDLQHPNKKGSIQYIDLLRKDGVLPTE